MKIEIAKADPPDLLCLTCGGEYITHDAVHVFNRKEDSKYGQHVTIYNGDIH